MGGEGIVLSQGSTAVTAIVNNNQIGGSGAGAITDTLVGGYAMYAITSSAGNVNATGNTIRNISGNSNAATTIVMSGMLLTGTGTAGPNIISQNVIHSLSNNSGAASNSIYALYCSFPAATANVVERNFVHSLSITSTATTTQLVGILPVAGQGTYKNNMVRLGLDANGASITPGYQIYGMFEIAGTNNLYFNSVYIGGTGVVGTGQSTFAFVSNVTSGARNYLDNIFWNARSTDVGTGNNFAIALSGPGFTSNYNDLYATGTNGFVGSFVTNDVTLAAWQADTGQDANSISVDPQYINPNGNAPTGDLHIFPTSPCVGAGLTIAGITNDFDNDPRANPPAIGADQPPGGPSPTPTATATLLLHPTALLRQQRHSRRRQPLAFTPTATATFTPTATATFTPTATHLHAYGYSYGHASHLQPRRQPHSRRQLLPRLRRQPQLRSRRRPQLQFTPTATATFTPTATATFTPTADSDRDCHGNSNGYRYSDCQQQHRLLHLQRR